jgi:hypothetical protein
LLQIFAGLLDVTRRVGGLGVRKEDRVGELLEWVVDLMREAVCHICRGGGTRLLQNRFLLLLIADGELFEASRTGTLAT